MTAENKALKIFGFIINTILTLAIVLVIAYMALLAFSKKTGKEIPITITPSIVLSNSMEPEFSAGSLIFIKKTKISEIMPNDIIVYEKMDSSEGETLIVHRAIAVKDAAGNTAFADLNQNKYNNNTGTVANVPEEMVRIKKEVTTLLDTVTEPGKISISTMGDNNSFTVDPEPVTEENYVGKKLSLTIPFVGFILADMKGTFFIGAATFFVILLVVTPYIIELNKDDDE